MNFRNPTKKGAQNFPVLFLEGKLRHISKRTASIITFISPSEHTVTGKLKQICDGLNSALASDASKGVQLFIPFPLSVYSPNRKSFR